MDSDDNHHDYEMTTEVVLTWPTCQGVGDTLGQFEEHKKEMTEAPREKPGLT